MKAVVILAAIVVLGMSLVYLSSAAKGDAEKSLTLARPDKVTIKQGGTALVTIKIERKNFTQNVTVHFSDLPEGVSVTDAYRMINGPEQTYTLAATDSAGIINNHFARVTVEMEDLRATELLNITILPK